MNTRVHIISTAALAAASAVLAASPAFADSALVDGSHYSIENWSETEGNSLIGNFHMLFNRDNSMWTPTVSSTPSSSFAVAESDFFDYGYLFNSEYQFIGATASGVGQMSGSGPFTYSQSASASFYILQDQIASPVVGPCDGKGTCASVSSHISKTLFSTSYPFSVGPVPVTVSADINADLFANASAEGYGVPFINRQGNFMGNPRSSLGAGASVSATLRAFAGIEDVLAVGVTGNFGIISVSVTPQANELVIAYPGHGALNWTNSVPVNVTTMNGSVDVWAEITPLWTPSTNVVSWGGYSLNQNLYSDTGKKFFP
jgi:hypothetical protein